MTTVDGKEDKKLDFSKVSSLIPRHCLEKSLSLSLFYMFRDLALLATSLFTWNYVKDSYFGLLLYWNVYGFIMWCIFVVGHDCGHGSFSNYPIINDICGHICHMLLFVPYWPWAYSHHKHHLYHNHKIKDHSHLWYTKNEWDETAVAWIKHGLVQIPFTSLFAYLYLGFCDGSHLVPFGDGSLYRNEKKMRPKVECVVSNIVNGFFAYFLYSFFSFEQLAFGYLPCWIMFSFWLFMVTYLQHHDETTELYDDDTFEFNEAAMQTVDREYGYGIDDFHHNISDCHVVHHLYFTKIPHYHLKEATMAIRGYLKESGRYKFVKHQKWIFIDFYIELFATHFTGEMKEKVN